MLDGLFNLTYFATGLFTVKVATLVAGGDDTTDRQWGAPLADGGSGGLIS